MRRARTATLLGALALVAASIPAQDVPRAAAPDGRAPARPDLRAPPATERPDPRGLPLLDVLPAGRVDLARADYLRDGRPSDAVRREEVRDVARAAGARDDASVPAAPAAILPVDGSGVRWTTAFATDASGTSRLFLDWSPGADGVLFEVFLDGERLPPPRDGWRPSRRRLLVDLGPRWLGRGEHLLEFVAREERADGAFVLHALELRPPE